MSSGTMYRPRDEIFFWKLRDILGFHMIPTTEQPKGRCVWGLGLRSRALGTCFAEKLVRRFVPLICWDFFADLGGDWGGFSHPMFSMLQMILIITLRQYSVLTDH